MIGSFFALETVPDEVVKVVTQSEQCVCDAVRAPRRLFGIESVQGKGTVVETTKSPHTHPSDEVLRDISVLSVGVDRCAEN